MNCIVTIGRNIGDEPMPEYRWLEFKSEAIRLALEWGPVVVIAEGEGEYEAGMQEGTFTVTATGRSGSRKGPILEGAARLARKYSQRSIAVTFGQPMFIGPMEVEYHVES